MEMQDPVVQEEGLQRQRCDGLRLELLGVCLLEGKAEAGLQHSWRYTRDEAFKVRSENCELGAVYDRLPPSSQASSAWTSTSPPPPWLSPPPLPPEEVLKDILDELTGVQGRVNKIEMMIIKLLNQKNESKETIKHC